MILDDRLEFCDATLANTGAAGTYLLGDQVDLGGQLTRDVGAGENLFLVLQVDTTFTSGGAATAQFHLASDDTASIATNGSATYHFSTGAFSLAQLTAGAVLAIIPLPQGRLYERFLGILQTTAVAALTGGRLNAFLVKDPAAWRAYDAPAQA